MLLNRHKLADDVYVELVRSLFDPWLPTAIMGCAFVGAGWLIKIQSPSTTLDALFVVGATLSVVRIFTLLKFRRAVRSPSFNAVQARTVEAVYASIYLSFAIILGIFGAVAFHEAAEHGQTLLVALIVGYCAGVATGTALRPWLSVPSMLVAVAPLIGVSALAPELIDKALAFVLVALVGGGINSVLARYRSEIAKIDMRRSLEGLARLDHLTGLHNRLSLKDRHRELAGQASCAIAIHCIDLDRFKPINDEFGHPTGDALLRTVSARIQNLIRDDDLAVRLGGDEFIVLQAQVRQFEDTEALAWRLVHALGRPYTLLGNELSISASVGCCVASGDIAHLDSLINLADDALLKVKRMGGGAVQVVSTIDGWQELKLGSGVRERTLSASIHQRAAG